MVSDNHPYRSQLRPPLCHYDTAICHGSDKCQEACTSSSCSHCSLWPTATAAHCSRLRVRSLLRALIYSRLCGRQRRRAWKSWWRRASARTPCHYRAVSSAGRWTWPGRAAARLGFEGLSTSLFLCRRGSVCAVGCVNWCVFELVTYERTHYSSSDRAELCF